MSQAIRRKRNCLWFDRLASLKTARYLSLSCPTVMLRKASISSRRPVDLSVSVFIVLTSSHMRAGILGTVNFLPERFGEAQAHVGGGKYGGDLTYGFGAISVAVVHERSPWRPPTTMSALRSMRRLVGLSTRSFPRPFTIYAGNVEDVSLGAGDFARALTNSERRNQRRGDGARRGSGTGQEIGRAHV